MLDTKTKSNILDTLRPNVYSSRDNQSMHKSLNGEFILYQLLMEYLLDEKIDLPKIKYGLCHYFKPDSQLDQRILKEFDQDYRSDKAIHWYRKESCLSQILTKALRTQNLDDVIAFSKFIRDINKQLKDEYKLLIKNKKKSSIIQVYQGYFIHKDEINRLKSNQGELISMNTFLSTTTNKDQALQLLTNRLPSSDDFTSILLEIYVNIQSPSRPFGEIKHLSDYTNDDDDDILFMFGCIFRLDDLWYDDQWNIWRSKLTLCGDNDSDMKDLTIILQNEFKGKNKQIAFGSYLYQMQKYSQAQEYYEKLFEKKTFNDPVELAYCHYGLYQINYVKAEYKSAVNNLNKALDCLVEYSQENNHPLIAQSYNDLGKVYTKEKNFISAFQFYNKALRTLNNDYVTTYSGLAHIYYKLEDYYLSLEYLHKALDSHPATAYALVAKTFIYMGEVYAKMNQIDKALDMFDNAIDSQLKVLNSDHPDLSYTYGAKGMMYSDMGDQDKALEYMEKAYRLQLETLPSTHSDLTKTYRNYGDIYMRKGELDKALSYYHKSLENRLKTFSWNHPLVGESYRLIGNIYWKKKDYDKSINYFHKLFLNETDRFTFGNGLLSSTFKCIADIYLEKKDYDHALQYYQKLLENELVKKLPEDISLVCIYKILARIFYKKRHLSQALLYYNRLLNCHLRRQPMHQSSIIEIYKKIGRIYLRKRHFDETLLYYEKSRNESSSKSKTSIEVYKDIDNIHFERRHLDESLFYFEKCLEQQMKEYSSHNISINKNYLILGNISLEKHKFGKAFKYFTLLLNAELKKKYFNDPSLIKLYKFLGNISYEETKYDQSLSYFYRLIDCLIQRRPTEDNSIVNTYIMIGRIFLKKHYQNQLSNYLITFNDQTKQSNPIDILYEKYHLDQTLIYFKKFLEKKTKSNMFNKDSIYIIIANIHLQKQEPHRALLYFHLLIKFQLEKQPAGDRSTAIIYSIMGDIYFKLADFSQALMHYQNSLVIYQRIYPNNHSAIITAKYKIRDSLFPVL